MNAPDNTLTPKPETSVSVPPKAPLDRQYHLRRLALSYFYEYLLKLISWAISIPRKHLMVVGFAAACVVIGACFLFSPDSMAAVFGFTQLVPKARVDVQAYYGTMLMALGVVIAWLAGRREGLKAAYLLIIAVCGGSAIGRLLGMLGAGQLIGLHAGLMVVEIGASWAAWRLYKVACRPEPEPPLPVLEPKTPEEFQPLSSANFTQPYDYYKMLRDQYPVYKMPGQDYYMVSRYQDIIDLAKDTDSLSSKLVEILATGKPKDPNQTEPSLIERMGEWGVIPVDVFALQDPPIHTQERKIGHSGFNAKFIKSLEPEVETLCNEMIEEALPNGNIEFIQDFAWRLPMRLIIRLLGFPEKDFEQIKDWCVDGIRSLSGTASKAESIAIGASAAQFMRYLWDGYLKIKANPDGSFTAKLAALADDPNSVMTDQRAIATLFQLLIAGSDSSASSMGAALLKIAENPDLEARLRANPEEIPNFIEEVFRTESAFQGHFRLTKKPMEIHGVSLPTASRVFLMWASGNRDERFWDDPDTFNMDRKNVKKHLTFGHGIHACLGRELARMEIRIVIQQWLARTERIAVVGETPYEASIFARTLVRLPLAFRVAEHPK